MDYKEKYEQGLECIQEILDSGQEKIKMTLLKERLLPFFPELKESEGERIRKALITFFQRFPYDSIEQAGTNAKEAIAWLEKQGEQKVPINDFKAKNWYVSEVDGKIHDMTYNPTDKVEPKFKVGDWIITKDKNVHKDYSICKIVEIENNRYHLENGDYLDIDTLEQYDYYLWTIQDAKDGDVLAFSNDTIVMFKNLYNSTTFHSYCHIEDGVFNVSKDDVPDWWEGKGFYPATKEQREILMKAMTDAGYQWDAEKKELKLLISNGGDF